MPTSRLIVFVRAPQLGAVKTRLAVALGPDAALAAYRRLLDTLSHSLKNLPGVELRHTPDAAGELLQPWLQPGWTLAGQGSGPLGERLSRAAEQAFQEGVEQLFIIGSDSPEITEQDIQSAWNVLQTTDVVLGPAEDGGYWGIGLRGPFCEAFQSIDWSTPAATPTNPCPGASGPSIHHTAANLVRRGHRSRRAGLAAPGRVPQHSFPKSKS
jgi:rSAM/selenodomain-associated transferase 1